MSQLEVDKIVPQSGTTLTIGDSGDTINFADGQNISIDTNTLYIDSTNNRVGIGTSSPDQKLHITDSASGSVSSILTIENPNGGSGTGVELRFVPSAYNNNIGSTARWSAIRAINGGSGNPTELTFLTNPASGDPSERMRIDSSGNVLVGKSSVDYTTAGTIIRSDGALFSTTNGSNTAVFERLTSDGDIIRFEKDNTTVGKIGARGGNLYVGNGDVALKYSGTNDAIFPSTAVDGAGRDNAIDLGASGTRFKDIYLSGGAFIGGTAAANKLDDYEEGTWTVKLCDASSGGNEFGYTGIRIGNYTKIGDTVIAQFYARTDGSTTGITTSNQLFVQGLPFTTNADNFYTSVVATTLGTLQSTLGTIYAQAIGNGNYMRFRKQYGDTSSPYSIQTLLISEWEGGHGASVHGTIIYKV